MTAPTRQEIIDAHEALQNRIARRPLMDREEVLSIVHEARKAGAAPNLRNSSLGGVDLSAANLSGVDLCGADLRGADLRGASLYGVDLCGANLYSASLHGSDLRHTNLRDANLRYASLRDANLYDATWFGLRIDGLPSRPPTPTPTPNGWDLSVGCWYGTPDKLRALIAKDEGWPGAKGDEITRRRPYLEAALALCEVHMKDNADYIKELKEKWNG